MHFKNPRYASKLRTLFCVVFAIVAAANEVAATERAVNVSAGPEASIGFGRFCHLSGDLLGCASLQGAIGVRGTASMDVSPTLSFGFGGSYSNLPSQHFDIWKATFVGTQSLSDTIDSGTWISLEAGLASTTAVQITEFGDGVTKAFRAPHAGLSLGQSWQPSANTVFRLAFQGAISFFQTDHHSIEDLSTVTWMGLAAAWGYDFH